MNRVALLWTLPLLIVGIAGAYLVIDASRLVCSSAPEPLILTRNATHERPIIIGSGEVTLLEGREREVPLSVFAAHTVHDAQLIFGPCIGFERTIEAIAEPVLLGTLETNTTTKHTTRLSAPLIENLTDERFTCSVRITDAAGAPSAYGSFILTIHPNVRNV